MILQIRRQISAFLEAVDSFIASFGLDINKLAQVGHFLAGYALTFTAFVVGWVCGAWWAGLIVAFLISVPWVIWKEAYRDTLPPENASFWPNLKTPFVGSGLLDAISYWSGVTLAIYLASAIGMAFPR